MKTFKQHLIFSWNTIFRDSVSFWKLFLLGSGLGLFLQITLYILGYDMSDQKSVEQMFQDTPVLIFTFIVSILAGILAFFGLLQLGAIVQNKKNYTLQKLFSEWKRIFPYIGTMLCLALYYFLFILAGALLAGIFFGSFWLLSSFQTFLLDLPRFILIAGGILGVVASVVLVLFFLGLSIWFLFSFFTLSIPAFILDNKKYFQASLCSYHLLRGRWWKTFGYFTLISICMVLLFMFVGGVEMILISVSTHTNIISLLLEFSLQQILGLLFYAFIFSLYQDYSRVSK